MFAVLLIAKALLNVVQQLLGEHTEYGLRSLRGDRSGALHDGILSLKEYRTRVARLLPCLRKRDVQNGPKAHFPTFPPDHADEQP